MKRRWGILFLISASLMIGLNGCEDSGDDISSDLCPEDPNKTGPGVCGCGVSDDDLNNNTIPDCFEQDMDLCPEDPAKTLPGVCGCGVADTDTDGDTLPDCLDACPEDPLKTSQGFCGCGVVDSVENIADSDGDGVINCLDYCPNEKTKHEKPEGEIEQAQYCAQPDTDGDGYDDPDDACPTNPTMHAWPEDGSVPNCGNYSEETNVFTISHPLEFEALQERLLKAYEPNSCTESSMVCDGNNLRRCHTYGMYRTLQCTSCTTNEETGEVTYECDESADFLPFDDVFLKIEMANDIDLGDWLETKVLPNGSCVPSDFNSLSNLINVHWDGKGHTIRYTHNGVRCTLPKALMSSVVSSTFENTNIDLDVEGTTTAILFESVDASILKNVTVSGSLTAIQVANAGGVAGVLQNTMTEPMQMIDVAVKDISVVRYFSDDNYSETVSSTGGMFGYLMNTRKKLTHPITIDLSNVEQKVLSVKGGIAAAGLFGAILSNENVDAPYIEIANIKGQVDKVQGYKVVGGMIASLDKGVHIENIDWTSNEVECEQEVTGGLIGRMEGVISNVKAKVNSVKCANSFSGGLVGYNAGTIQNVDLRVHRVDGNRGTGGLIGIDLGTVSHVAVAFDTVKGAFNVGGAFGTVATQKPASDIAVRGNAIIGNNAVGGVVGSSIDRSWENVISYVDYIEVTNNGGTLLGGFAGNIQFNTNNTILDGANIRTDMMVCQENIGGFVGGLQYHNTISDKPAFSNISSQTNYVFQKKSSRRVGGLLGVLIPSSNTESISLKNVVSTASRYIVDETSPVTYGMLVGVSPKVTWNLENTFFYTSGDENETTFADGPDYSTTNLRYAETASDKAISTDQVVEKLGNGWTIDNYVLDGKTVKIPVLKIEGITLPDPVEAEEE